MIIEVGVSGLFYGQEEEHVAQYDEAASEEKFRELLQDALSTRFPGAEIIVSAREGTRVDSQEDHDLVPWVDQVVERVWGGWEWLVPADE
ncbi:MAG TPA: hypothetical protein ENJ31_01575 [Anaerolineae bacterium]|nr:hypothetical protein [Anaerolineae bacterium]